MVAHASAAEIASAAMAARRPWRWERTAVAVEMYEALGFEPFDEQEHRQWNGLTQPDVYVCQMYMVADGEQLKRSTAGTALGEHIRWLHKENSHHRDGPATERVV